MGMNAPRYSVLEGVLACAYLVLLALAALIWVLLIPPPDRSHLSRPRVPPLASGWTPQAVEAHNAEIWAAVQLRQGRCIYCATQPYVYDVWGHLDVSHTPVEAQRARQFVVDASHRVGGR